MNGNLLISFKRLFFIIASIAFAMSFLSGCQTSTTQNDVCKQEERCD